MPHRKERSNLDEAIYKASLQEAGSSPSLPQPQAPTLVQIYEQVACTTLGIDRYRSTTRPASRAISLIFTPLVGPDDARLDTQDVKTVLSHVCDCQALLDRLHIPGDDGVRT
jgi:hypothetical protein